MLGISGLFILWFALAGLVPVFTSQALAAAPAAGALKVGEAFPDVPLAGDLTEEQKGYLGLSGAGPWKFSDIKAGHVIIEVFSMYCPYCQAEAPAVNAVYEALRASEHADAVKMIGIGAGNSAFEVDFFRTKYGVAMPLFEDAELSLHELLGNPGTPHFYVVRLGKQGGTTVYSQTGRMESEKAFLAQCLKAAGR
ncbi:TlpA family protein disulfide reductase [Desulfovibrio psychrotolerans]|uniref:Alkyl hydroperoxide reductase n=1 Tax=Desulfovibrio psychrotolerans TaxID=415242 RepID=A0A7J0BXS9_9BACT|nr:TlpA disulfide reductase family protein [Desulfovibrio psychrotolerans]GFM38506.1 alkyl hydroperoxide reductase [Desulfovibrio psychrotolerans]